MACRIRENKIMVVALCAPLGGRFDLGLGEQGGCRFLESILAVPQRRVQ